jgi:LemA protein
MTYVLVPLGVIAVVVLWAIAIYNRLVKRTTMVEEGWSGIDTQLKRRANLIPNLVETVKGYMGRGESLDAGSVGAQGIAEAHLTAALGKLFALAEAYPDLKASANFTELQTALQTVEDEIQLSRRYYNGTVRDLNVLVDSFPSNLVANGFNFRKAEFFEIEDAADRAVPEVEFS